jgi:hypothetical protein
MLTLDDKKRNQVRKAYDLGGFVQLSLKCGIPEDMLDKGEWNEKLSIKNELFTQEEKKIIFELTRKAFYLNEMKVKEFEQVIGI